MCKIWLTALLDGLYLSNMKSMNGHFGHAFGISPMGERGQVVIPKRIRELLNLRTKEDLIFFCQGKAIIAMPASKFQGLAKAMVNHTKDIEKMAKRMKKK